MRLIEIHMSALEFINCDFLDFIAQRTYEQGFDPDLQLVEVHGFCQIIIGAGPEHCDSVLNVILRGSENNDRDIDTALPQFDAYVHCIDSRLRMIDDDQVEAV